MMVDSFISCFCGRSSGDNPPPFFFSRKAGHQVPIGGQTMLTISSILFHWLQDKEKLKEKTEFTHPFQNPRFQTDLFPKSAQFLDFQWTPTGLSGQFRGVLSGLKPLEWRNLLQCDGKQFGHELMLKRALMEKGGGYRWLLKPQFTFL